MTKMIKVTCPSCKTALSLSEQHLRETDGRADCHHCGHVFRLVKKKKAETPPPAEPPKKERPKTDPFFADVGVNDPIFPTDGFPTGNRAKQEKAKPKTANKSAVKLNYREPKAENKNRNTFADVGQKPLAFNMLDADSANAQIPQVSIKPAVQGNALAMNSTGNPDQQNNITIHTDSLVFTLVGDNNGTDNNVIDAGGNKSNAPIVVSSGNDLNWTIATIAALIALIVQLFYLVLMLQ